MRLDDAFAQGVLDFQRGEVDLDVVLDDGKRQEVGRVVAIHNEDGAAWWYVTNVSRAVLPAADVALAYSLRYDIERAFRTLKTIDIRVRPINHHLEDRVRAHIFLCMLAYYVEWHMREAWRPLLFADEDQAAKAARDPVAPAQRSAAALNKASTKRLDDGTEVHSFQTLMDHLAGIVRNTCRRADAADHEPTFHMTTPPNPKQKQALDLLESINV